MSKPIGPQQRERLERLVAGGDADEALRLLAEWVHTHELTPWAMEWLGRMYLARGERVRAGRLFFWAGVREGHDVQAAIAMFLRRPLGQLLRTLWRHARVPFDSLPANVQADLRTFGVDPARAGQVLPRRRTSPWSGLLRFVFRGLLAVVFLVGVVTCVEWLVANWAGR